jgi:DNA-binding transcriptional ArsR family regulator
MITIAMTPDDLVGMRFAYRPIMEIPLSYRVLINPAFQGRYGSWVEETRHSLHGIDLPYLDALVQPTGYIPDFLTPTPTTTNRRSIHDDLADVLATPDDVIHQHVLNLIAEDGDSEMRRFFVAHPREAVQCLVDDLLIYWTRTLDSVWTRMISILETDILYRARILAMDGPAALFGDLHPTISYDGQQITIMPLCMHRHHETHFSLEGDGLQLVPLVFSGCGRVFQIVPEYASMLAYTVRGTGMWYEKPSAPNKSLEMALGSSRAAVLEALTTPQTTSELAFRLHVTAGTVSQHLMRLADAGLITPRRSGKRVYYHLTERGEKLIALFDPAG